MVSLLLKNGAAGSINEKNDDKCTALMFACQFGSADKVRLLLANGAGDSIHEKKRTDVRRDLATWRNWIELKRFGYRNLSTG